jgi:anti-sigma regulatory factor (Ser/Thr protein kinase)
MSIAPDLAASGAARAALTEWAAGHVPPQVIEDLRLLVSELVTNSLRHAELGTGDDVRVGASLNNGSLRLEVENPGMAGDVGARLPDPDGAGGYGLQLVAALAEHWGVVRDGTTRVWAEIGSHPME